MVFLGGLVVSPGGGDFTVERAEVYDPVVDLDSGFDFSLVFVPFKALVFRAGSCFSLGFVAEVLRNGCGSQV